MVGSMNVKNMSSSTDVPLLFTGLRQSCDNWDFAAMSLVYSSVMSCSRSGPVLMLVVAIVSRVASPRLLYSAKPRETGCLGARYCPYVVIKVCSQSVAASAERL